MKSSAMRRNRSKIGHSLVWTPEEAKYLRAIFRWQESTPSLDDEKRRRQEEAARRRQQEQKPAGECRLLIVGGRGTGKTAILTRVSLQFLSTLDITDS
jgi:Cdc6-like AAA superfamily ATPase